MAAKKGPQTAQASCGTVLYRDKDEAVAEHGEENVVREVGTGYYYNSKERLTVHEIKELRDQGVF